MCYRIDVKDHQCIFWPLSIHMNTTTIDHKDIPGDVLTLDASLLRICELASVHAFVPMVCIVGFIHEKFGMNVDFP